MEIPASNITDYRRYELHSSIKQKKTWQVDIDVKNFLYGKYSNIDEVRKNALEIISNYPFESATYLFFQKMQKEDSWKLETEKQRVERRVERRSPAVHDYFRRVAERARMKEANSTVYYDMEPIVESSGLGILPRDSYYNRNTSPISVMVSATTSQENRPTSPPPAAFSRPPCIVFQPAVTLLSKKEIKEKIAELAEEIYAFNQHLLKKLESTDDVNAQLHVSDMAEKKLTDITRYM